MAKEESNLWVSILNLVKKQKKELNLQQLKSNFWKESDSLKHLKNLTP
jgi:hypothetical protein